MIINLSGKHALITGASMGIGRSISEELAKAGAKITTVARSAGSPIEGADHTPIQVDFSDPDEALAELQDYIKSAPVDILINNTGGPRPGPITKSDWQDFTLAMNMHLRMSHGLMQAVTPHMKSQGFGRIINVISTSVKMPITGLGVSNTTRAAMAGWSKTLSFELAPFGITVNNILPGFIQTTRLDAIVEAKAKAQNSTNKEASEIMKSYVPAGRFGKPEEMAHVAVFLASEYASYVNGTNIPIDGGRTTAL